MLKICMLGVIDYDSDARVKGYAESLCKHGVCVDVLALHGSAKAVSSGKNGVRVYNVPIRRTGKNRLAYLLEYEYSFLLLSFLLLRMFVKHRYDIIHVHNMPDFLVFAGLIPKLLGARIILDIHDPMPEVYLSKYPDAKNGIGERLIRLEERISTRFADVVITANSHFRENLMKRGLSASKTIVINNFPDASIFDRSRYRIERDSRREHFTLIFPGTIAPRYGLDVAIRALPLIRHTIGNIKLLIIGRKVEHAKTLASIAEQLDVSSLVEFKPLAPNDEIPKQLARADVGIYPALPDPHMSIATPGKLLEFAAMGIPILSSRLRIVEEMFDQSAIMLFEPGNISQFAECVIRLYENPALREELVLNADRMFAEKLSWEREFQKYWEMLRRLLPESLEALDAVR